LHDIADGQGSQIAAVLKISGIERLLAHFVEDPATLGPCWKDGRRSGGNRSGDVLIAVVFLGSADEGVLGHVFDNLKDFGLREGKGDDQAIAVLKDIFFAAKRRDGRRSEKKKEQREYGYAPENNRGMAFNSMTSRPSIQSRTAKTFVPDHDPLRSSCWKSLIRWIERCQLG
jgi:hypothetical protein